MDNAFAVLVSQPGKDEEEGQTNGLHHRKLAGEEERVVLLRHLSWASRALKWHLQAVI